MKQNAPILDRQLDFLDQQTEGWNRGHDLAILCCDIEDLIGLAMETRDLIQRHCDRFNGNPQAAGDGSRLVSYWNRWHAIGIRALADVDWIEHRGYIPEHSTAFRKAVYEASIAANYEKMLAAQRRFDAGGGRPLEEIDDELSHSAGH